MIAMEEFLNDFEVGLAQGCYVNGELPDLPFEDGAFDIGLCSHLLFLYSDQFSADLHVQSIKELCRVAAEARFFPLPELGSKKTRHLDTVRDKLNADGYAVSIEEVPYEFQRGGNEMLRVAAT
jgi:ubiquinone/menaquinone biosynthesis C-methylase UbiE